MKISSEIALFLVLGLAGCSKQQPQPSAERVSLQAVQVSQATLTPAERAHILDEDFTIIQNTGSIPEPCKSAFVVVARETKFEMADPSQKFQATDVVVERGLPRRRLIFAGVNRNRCFIHCKRGGIAHSFLVVVFDTSIPDQIKFLWGGLTSSKIDRFEQLRSAINKGECKETLPYYGYYW